MTTQEIRQRYLDFLAAKKHEIIQRAQLVPQDDPTTLFTGSGMQPLLPYLLGEEHPKGTRLANSQTCLRSQDIDDVGDNRHTIFFEMLGNWSLGDYFKKDQIAWFFDFLINEVGLDPNKIYVTCFIGDEANGIPKDEESAEIWRGLYKSVGIDAKIVELGSAENGDKLGMQGGRIFYYDDGENWWSRGGGIAKTPMGDPCGPDSEVFYDFGEDKHDEAVWGLPHPASDSGRFMEIGNNVFMQYKKTPEGFVELPKQNVDFGGGLERIAAAAIDEADVFKISLLWPIIAKLESLSGLGYDENQVSMRVIADHMRAAVWLVTDNVTPSNKEQGYVLRRIIRRALRFAFDLGIEAHVSEDIVPIIVDLYRDDFPEIADNADRIIAAIAKEENVFRQTLRKGSAELNKLLKDGTPDAPAVVGGEAVFKLYDTYGYPKELSTELIESNSAGQLSTSWEAEFEAALTEQRQRSRTAEKGDFKGGLADHSEITTKYHTATHLMYRALRNVLGEHVVQRGSNITSDRLRFDFSHDAKMSPEQIQQVEDIVNEQIAKDWPMTWREEQTKIVLSGNKVLGAFGDRYGDTVKVYSVGDPDGVHYSREICGGPHVEHTGALGESGRKFKILKEESSSAGVRRIKAALV